MVRYHIVILKGRMEWGWIRRMPNLLFRNWEGFGWLGKEGHLELRRKSFSGYMDQAGRKPLPRALWNHARFKALVILAKERHWFPSSISLKSGQSKVVSLESNHYFLLNPHQNLLENRCFLKFHFPPFPISPHPQGQIQVCLPISTK